MTVQTSRGTYVSDLTMHTEDENVEMYLLHEYSPNFTNSQTMYKLLLEDLQSRNIRHFERCVEQSLRRQPPSIDLNYAYPDQSGKTLLDIACKEGLTKFVKFLLKKGAKVNRISEHDRGPIHLATEYRRHDVLGILLDEPTINPNLEAGQATALHMAVRNKDRRCAELLLEKGASPNIPNSRGLTALHMAAMSNQKDMVNLILEKSKHTLDFDTYKYNERTAREVLQEKLPDIALPPVVKRGANVHDLKYYLKANDETNFLRCFKEIQGDLGNNIVDLIEIAVQKNFKSLVSVLLKKAETVDCNLKRAAYYAVQRGSPDILGQLLDSGIEVENDLLMDACVELGIPRKGASHCINDRLECLKLLLERDVDVRCTDSKGNTPLHYAARANCPEAVALLLAKGSYIGHMNKFNVPPVADISASTLSEYFDECIQVKKERPNEYTIEFDYKCLIPHDTSYKEGQQKSLISQEMGEMDIFQFIADRNGLKDILTHPLLSSFLYLKWHRIRHILWLNFIFYGLFYLLLNTYILQVIYTKDYTEVETEGWNFVLFLRIATGLATALFAVRNILQLLSAPCHYLSSLENWIEMPLIILAFAVLYNVNIQIAAIIILLSTWELMILIGKYPRMSTVIEMFKTVSINFMRFLFLYAFLIVAFALAFFTLFKDADKEQTNFHDFWQSLFKTIIMLTGELEAADIPFVSHPILSHLIFVFFVFLITIVLLNLLNGLAVSDTARILRKAELVGLISRVQVLTYIENVAIGAPFIHGRHHIVCNGLLHKCKCNPPAFLARKVLLFPSYLKSGKLSVKSQDSLEGYGNNLRYTAQSGENSTDKVLPNMVPQVMKRVKDILSRRSQKTTNEKIINKLERLEERFEAIEIVLKSIQRKLENNNVNVAGGQED